MSEHLQPDLFFLSETPEQGSPRVHERHRHVFTVSSSFNFHDVLLGQFSSKNIGFISPSRVLVLLIFFFIWIYLSPVVQFSVEGDIMGVTSIIHLLPCDL